MTIGGTPQTTRAIWHDNVGAALFALLPLLYVYMPRPPIEAARFMVLPALGLLLLLFVLLFLSRRATIDRAVFRLLLVFLLLSLATSISFLWNAAEIRTTALLEVLRPALFAVCLCFGYYLARAYGETELRRGLLAAAYGILLGQLVIAIAQLLDIGSVGLVYSEDKTRPLGTLLRATGSLGNPNALGWVVTQAVVIIYAFNRQRFLPWSLIGGVLVLASGSRSTVFLFPVALALTAILSRTGRGIAYHRVVGLGIGVLGVLLACITAFPNVFPYLAQLRDAVELGSLTAVSSFANRLAGWQHRYQLFLDGGVPAWILGLGSRGTMRVVDNDYLYVLFRLGILGFVVQWTGLLYALRILLRSRGRTHVAAVGLQYLIAAALLGFLFETLGGWMLPVLLWFYIGLSVGCGERFHKPLRGTGQTQAHRGAEPAPAFANAVRLQP